MVVIGLSETTHLKYLSQFLAHYICTEKIDGVYDYYYHCAMHYYPTSSIGSQHFQCEESTLFPIHRVVSSIDFTLIRASPLHATTGSSSFLLPREPPSNEPSSLGASVIPWWSPAWVCIDSHYPHTPHPTPQGPDSFDAHVAAWQEQKDKTLLVSSLHNKTFGNLEGHRYKRPDFFFPFFSFSPPKQMVVCPYQQLLQSHTSIKEHEISRKPRQGSSTLPTREFACLQDKQKGRGKGSSAQRASHWGDLSSQPPPHFQKLVFLTFTLCHLKLGTQTRQGQ